MENGYVDKVRALLAKAESTPFAEEAEALTAKAQELMAKYAINEAMLAAAGSVTKDKIGQLEIVVDAPYTEAKAALVFAIARANDCEAVYWGSAQRRRIELIGYQSALETVKMLHTSLLVQSAIALKAAVMMKPRGEHGKTFSNSFLHAYASRISTRLQAATKQAATEVQQDTDRSVALVLASRKDLVKEAFDTYHPNVRMKSINHANWSQSGATMGRNAADGAHLGSNRAAGRGSKGELA